ncbi:MULTISPECIES: single-stranded DNA-binding protein [Methylosinus]|uniref:Single-stranded DNA-binding protein n=1 Tax=Methylosinus trichosporium (strain ATCC 35070 / NCIMB 11131 / UNIQEM 75 / OB3b) TaxID=595536 RepID=A0A2D2CX81_METT3|nr:MULTISPECIES: single-stranded DNA-binding protein [Methylosinus]ATQ67352.1 single-stranded DNA-binding protein [Methylosinus trichosporium OB3b]OBS51634.1 hypothetical protein A8B73_15600 [Methylosinus sp. 3S-1]
MSALALISGTIGRRPERRTARTGKPFVTASLRAVGGGSVMWWSVVAFDDGAAAELLALVEGDAVAIGGPMKAEIWAPADGKARVNLSIVATTVASLKAAQRKSKATPRAAERKSGEDRGTHNDLNDDMPF